jgi:hypothetical protein
MVIHHISFNPVMSQRALARVPHVPSIATMKTMEAESGNDSQTSECASHRQIGRPPKLLRLEEELVAGGFVLSRFRENKLVSGHASQDFIMENFSVKVSCSWISDHLFALGFRSHATRSSDQRCVGSLRRKQKRASHFLTDLRALIARENIPLDHIFAIDEKKFWNSGVVLRSYSPDRRVRADQY